MRSIICVAGLIVAISALGYRPHGYPGAGGLLGGHGGGIDPLTLLLLKGDGLGGGKSGINSLLPLLLLGGGGLGGKHGKHGGINPLLFALLNDCKEQYTDCTQPTVANANSDKLCGEDTSGTGYCTDTNGMAVLCKKCCTCPPKA